MNKIRYGILSTAQIVPRFVKGINASKYGEVKAIASRSLEKAENMAQELGIPKSYGSYEELCKDEAIDIIYVATYNKGHFEAAKLALMNNKHVLLEKPFTLKSSHAQELFELANKKELFLMEAQKSVFLPITHKIKKILQNNQIGAVQWIQSITAYPNVNHISWFHSIEAGGGTLHGSGSYPLQYMQYILNQKITSFSGDATIESGKTDDQCNISLKFSNQVLGNLFITVKLDTESKLTIFAQKGRIEVTNFWKAQKATVFYDDGKKEELEAFFDSEFQFEVDHVNDCLRKKLTESPIMTKRITLDTVELVESLYTKWLKEG